MTTTAILNITEIADNQTDKATTANTAFTQLEKAIRDATSLNITGGGTYTISNANWRENVALKLVTASAATTVAIPAIKGTVLIQNASGQTVTLSRGSNTYVMPTGAKVWAMVGPTTADLTVSPAGNNPIRIQEKSDSYTLVLADAYTHIDMNKGTAQTLTVPLNSAAAFDIGTWVVVRQMGAGALTIAATGGVTLKSEGSLVSAKGQDAIVTLFKVASDTWVVGGNRS